MDTKQKIIKKYTQIVMKRIYNEDCYVFFRDLYGLRAIFRDKELPPYSIKDYPLYHKKPLCSITFNRKLYNNKDISPHIWNTIVHEITHYNINIEVTNYKQTFHSGKFKITEQDNYKKVDDLRKLFNKEIGFDENFEYDYIEEDYEEELNNLDKFH